MTLADLASAKTPAGGNQFLDDLRAEFLDNGVSIDQTFVCVLARRPSGLVPIETSV